MVPRSNAAHQKKGKLITCGKLYRSSNGKTFLTLHLQVKPSFHTHRVAYFACGWVARSAASEVFAAEVQVDGGLYPWFEESYVFCCGLCHLPSANEKPCMLMIDRVLKSTCNAWRVLSG